MTIKEVFQTLQRILEQNDKTARNDVMSRSELIAALDMCIGRQEIIDALEES